MKADFPTLAEPCKINVVIDWCVGQSDEFRSLMTKGERILHKNTQNQENLRFVLSMKQ